MKVLLDCYIEADRIPPLNHGWKVRVVKTKGGKSFPQFYTTKKVKDWQAKVRSVVKAKKRADYSGGSVAVRIRWYAKYRQGDTGGVSKFTIDALQHVRDKKTKEITEFVLFDDDKVIDDERTVRFRERPVWWPDGIGPGIRLAVYELENSEFVRETVHEYGPYGDILVDRL